MTGELPPHAQALGRIPSGLFILSAGTGDQATATLVSFVQQVGFEPPVVVVALRKGRFIKTDPSQGRGYYRPDAPPDDPRLV